MSETPAERFAPALSPPTASVPSPSNASEFSSTYSVAA
jgi:hypothetical protein